VILQATAGFEAGYQSRSTIICSSTERFSTAAGVQLSNMLKSAIVLVAVAVSAVNARCYEPSPAFPVPLWKKVCYQLESIVGCARKNHARLVSVA